MFIIDNQPNILQKYTIFFNIANLGCRVWMFRRKLSFNPLIPSIKKGPSSRIALCYKLVRLLWLVHCTTCECALEYARYLTVKSINEVEAYLVTT